MEIIFLGGPTSTTQYNGRVAAEPADISSGRLLGSWEAGTGQGNGHVSVPRGWGWYMVLSLEAGDDTCFCPQEGRDKSSG